MDSQADLRSLSFLKSMKDRKKKDFKSDDRSFYIIEKPQRNPAYFS